MGFEKFALRSVSRFFGYCLYRKCALIRKESKSHSGIAARSERIEVGIYVAKIQFDVQYQTVGDCQSGKADGTETNERQTK